MIPTLRWFGPSDSVTLDDIRAAGAHGVVTALHSVPNGQPWSRAAIDRRLAEIESAGPSESGKPLAWSVVESVPVHESIKTGAAEAEQHTKAFAKTLTNLGKVGIRTVCYNFMPVLDWTRTDLAYSLGNGGRSLRFSQSHFDAFELFELESEEAADRLDTERLDRARELHADLTEEDRARLIDAVCAGLPGSEESYTIDALRQRLSAYAQTSEQKLRSNLVRFLEQVVPHAEAANVRFALHPDDPPWPLLGLPRIASTAADYQQIFDAVPSPTNGLTFCSGSLGAREDNDLDSIIQTLGPRIHFVHLRNVARQSDGSFHETLHLNGDLDLVKLARKLKKISDRRDEPIPFRPDHGIATPSDVRHQSRPGYPYIGRLRGLAELQGVLAGRGPDGG